MRSSLQYKFLPLQDTTKAKGYSESEIMDVFLYILAEKK